MGIKIAVAFLILLMSLPSCSRDKVGRQCSPEPAPELIRYSYKNLGESEQREILKRIKQNRLKYVPEVKIDLSDVFESPWYEWRPDADFLEQYNIYSSHFFSRI
jgi:hypothetical protein